MAEDLISRKTAIDAMEDVDWYHINSNGQLVHGANSKEDEPLYKAEDVYKVLKEIPSAQPERESIKWIPHESIFGGPDERVYTCDKCGYNIGFHVENFCPNCGGKYERYEKKEGER